MGILLRELLGQCCNFDLRILFRIFTTWFPTARAGWSPIHMLDFSLCQFVIVDNIPTYCSNLLISMAGGVDVQAAREAGYAYRGGKADDVTGMVRVTWTFRPNSKYLTFSYTFRV